MTSYEAGFLTKCASSGVSEEAAYYLLKLAIDYQYAKPGYDIFGRPLSAPVPTEQQKSDAAASGISTPATAAPRPVSRRQTAASPLGAPDPVNPYGVRGTSTERKADSSPPAGSGLTASPAEAGVSQPATSTPTQPKATSAMGGTEPSFTGRSKSITMPDGTVVTRHQRSDGTWGRRPATSVTMPDGTVVSRPNGPNPYGVGG